MELCGASMTLSISRSGESSGKGSTSNTSSAAPPKRPLCSACTSAGSSNQRAARGIDQNRAGFDQRQRVAVDDVEAGRVEVAVHADEVGARQQFLQTDHVHVVGGGHFARDADDVVCPGGSCRRRAPLRSTSRPMLPTPITPSTHSLSARPGSFSHWPDLTSRSIQGWRRAKASM